jgi:hypothetical protein
VRDDPALPFVSIHILLSRGRIDEIAYRAVHQKIVAQDELIAALRVPAWRSIDTRYGLPGAR